MLDFRLARLVRTFGVLRNLVLSIAEQPLFNPLPKLASKPHPPELGWKHAFGDQKQERQSCLMSPYKPSGRVGGVFQTARAGQDPLLASFPRLNSPPPPPMYLTECSPKPCALDPVAQPPPHPSKRLRLSSQRLIE